MYEKNRVHMHIGTIGSCYVQPLIRELKVRLLYKLRATVGKTKTLGN